MDYLVRYFNVKKDLLECYIKIIYINNKLFNLETIEKDKSNISVSFNYPNSKYLTIQSTNNIIYKTYQRLLNEMNLFNFDISDNVNKLNLIFLKDKFSRDNIELEYNIITNKQNDIVKELNLFNLSHDNFLEKIEIRDLNSYFTKLNKLFYLYIRNKIIY